METYSFETECFLISPIGEAESEARRRADLVREHIVKEAVSALGLHVVRADDIAEPGQIDNQVIEHLTKAKLVVADLSGQNPNVFYELAVRHALGKRFVQILIDKEVLPLDIGGQRTVRYGVMADQARKAMLEVRRFAEAALQSTEPVDNPITHFVTIDQLRRSNPMEAMLASISDGLAAMRGELQALDRRIYEPDPHNALRGAYGPELDAIKFLTSRLQKTSSTLSALLSHDKTIVAYFLQRGIRKNQIISEVLGDLCDTLRRGLTLEQMYGVKEIMFRATYMEVGQRNAKAVLEYVAWATPDGHPPQSQTLGKVFELGDGIAGRAWELKSPVIVDDFATDPDWRDNYEGQRQRYQSMICVPTLSGAPGQRQDVLGVITIDTNVVRYFGERDNRLDQERFGGLVRPFAEYVVFITMLDRIVWQYKEIISSTILDRDTAT